MTTSPSVSSGESANPPGDAHAPGGNRAACGLVTDFYTGAAPAAPPALSGPSVWPYLKLDRSKTPVFEPAVPVILHGPANWATTTALLDSGAETSAIPFEWAEPLGVDLHQARSVTAFGNGVLCEYRQPVEPLSVELAGKVIPLRAVFAPWLHMILGRDVFDYFTVVFDQRAHQVVLDPYEPAP